MRLSVSVCVMLVAMGSIALAESPKAAKDGAATAAPATQPAKPANTKCPVSGDEIDPALTLQYEGKTIAFCCKDCVPEFKKDPQKYMKNLK